MYYDDELYHFGVKGMKWGVRRSRQQLSARVTKLSNKNAALTERKKALDKAARNYDFKASKVSSRNSKYQARINRATIKKAKFERKADKARSRLLFPNEGKAQKYDAKANRQAAIIRKNTGKLKVNKWSVKSEKTKVAAEKARRRIEKNERLKSTYSKTIKAMDSGKIEAGKGLLMRYMVDDN